MTERENILHVINRDGLAQWMPAGWDSVEMIMPTNVVRERPPYALGMCGSGYDYWGCWWEFEADIMGASPLPGRMPCKDITLWREQVTFPDISAIDWAPAEEVKKNLDKENKVSLFFWESGPWERLHALVGFQEALEYMYEEPEAFKELMQAITDFRCAMIPLIKEHYDPDIILTLDDFGHQKSQFMSNAMFREFIMPYETQIGNAIKENGMIYFHHSCGCIDNLMPEIVEMGASCMLGLFYPYNDQKAVLKKLGKDICFMSSVDGQRLSMPDVTEEELRNEVRRFVDTFGPYGNAIFDPMTGDPRCLEIIADEFYKVREAYRPYKLA